MFGFLKKIYNKESHRPHIAPASISPSSYRRNSNIQRELIRVVLKDTMRLHGIPLDWLACEVIIPQSPDGEELQIQLIVMKWNEKFLRYSLALQQQLLLGLDRFDPSVDHSKYIVSWRYSPTSGNPFVKMPSPNSWLSNDTPHVRIEPVPVLDRRQARAAPITHILEPSLFDTYDRRSSFQPTDISPLR